MGAAKAVSTMVKSNTTIMPAAASAANADAGERSRFESSVGRCQTDGPNAEQRRGPNEELLL